MLSTQYYVPNRNHMCRYKSSEKSWKTVKLLAYCQANYQKRFFKKLPITTEITSTPMTWKRPNLTWRIASISIQQESLRRPSIPDWQCKYSLEGTCVIPCERYVSYFVLKTSKIWKKSEIFLFIPDPKYLYRIWSYPQLLTPQKSFIHAGYKLFTTHWKFMTTIDLRKHSYQIRIHLYRVWNINTGSKIIRLSW